MISISNLSLYFGGQDVFDTVSLTVNKGDKIGLVGKNGAGKSTLLNLIDGNISPNDGKIAIPKGLNIGYLTQDLDFEDGFSVIDEAKKAFNEINLLQKEMHSLNHVCKVVFGSKSRLNTIFPLVCGLCSIPKIL